MRDGNNSPTASPTMKALSSLLESPPAALRHMRSDSSSSKYSSHSTLTSAQGREIIMGPPEVSIYTGISDRPLGWKARRPTRPTVSQAVRDANIKKFDGAARTPLAWDGLRRDPELWFPDGDCLVHLYERGASQRGPAFRIPNQALVDAHCQPLLEHCLFVSTRACSSPLDFSVETNGHKSFQRAAPYELYLPAPTTIDRSQAMLYHVATRNFFAFLFKRSLVGSELGTALIGVLNTMSAFRSADVNNAQDLLDYMDEEGYAEMRSEPGHAMAVLAFAEHFHFKDLYIDAFAHCAGMYNILDTNAEFKLVSDKSLLLLKRTFEEMHSRLRANAEDLSSFLEDELAPAFRMLPPGARTHLDRFRSFLHAYYVAKIGYYPPSPFQGHQPAFPKEVLVMMETDFKMLYDLLADTSSTQHNHTSLPHSEGEWSISQAVDSFDEINGYEGLDYLSPLSPGPDADLPISTIYRWTPWAKKKEKMELDPRLAALAAVTKATNRDPRLQESSFVRAYMAYEKDLIFNTNKLDRISPVPAALSRKIRWVVIYCMLQTLQSTTRVPPQVRDTDNVPYHMCVTLADGCPPFNTYISHLDVIQRGNRRFSDGVGSMFSVSPRRTSVSLSTRRSVMRLDTVSHQADSCSFSVSSSSTTDVAHVPTSSSGHKVGVTKPRQKRFSFHEILVQSYSNGTRTTITASPNKEMDAAGVHDDSLTGEIARTRHFSKDSELSGFYSPISSQFSAKSPASSCSSVNEDSDHGMKQTAKLDIGQMLACDEVSRIRHSVNGTDDHVVRPDEEVPTPRPLDIRKSLLNLQGTMMVTKSVTVEYEDAGEVGANSELAAYLPS